MNKDVYNNVLPKTAIATYQGHLHLYRILHSINSTEYLQEHYTVNI